ncbi:MAG TPA: hypothetical protein VJ861_06635 [Treponemataceae bacterium]|nr:hypothetical protein [Treponemataceae bacterium]
MKQKVLIFASNPETDKKIINELEKIGVQCKIACNLGDFHWILSVNTIDALIFDTQFFIDKCAKPLLVQKRFNSHHSIIEYFPNNTIHKKETIIKVYPEDQIINLSPIIQAVSRAVRIPYSATQYKHTEIGNDESSENELRYQRIAMLYSKDFITSLQKKQLDIFMYIANCGESGCKNDDIVEHIWGNITKSRKKDIQSYISKINTLLAKHDPENHTIVHCEKKYYVQKKQPE